ncbi:MAG: hypothetical protein N3G19_02705 [Candidatus Pacearchaeota archaeon]|nr:hypothetical protein [Candidatus Pacearchaeota archaeon]
MLENHNNLERIKKQYEPLKKKYKLPEFSKLNEEFEIEKIQEKETDFLLREIRRIMGDKIIAFLRFLEFFLNPQIAPLFVLTSIKNLTQKEKDSIEKIYKELANIELASVNLDINYEENKEAQFIKEILKKWQELKPQLQEVSEAILQIQKKSGEKKNKSYFG